MLHLMFLLGVLLIGISLGMILQRYLTRQTVNQLLAAYPPPPWGQTPFDMPPPPPYQH